MKDLLNAYTLPGYAHIFGTSAEEVAEVWAQEHFNIPIVSRFLTQIEHISENNEMPFHTISQVFELKADASQLVGKHAKYDYIWYDLASITQGNPDFDNYDVVLFIAEKLYGSHISPREVVKNI